MTDEKITKVSYAYVKGLEDEPTDFITNDIQSKLSQFAKEFNKQNGTLIICVIGHGRFRCGWEGIDKELNEKMTNQVSLFQVPYNP